MSTKELKWDDLLHCDNVFMALERIKTKGEDLPYDVNLDAISHYKMVNDKQKLMYFIEKSSNIEDFLHNIYRSDTDYKRSIMLVAKDKPKKAEVNNKYKTFGYFLGDRDFSKYIWRDEIEDLHIYLHKQVKNNVLLIGEPGCGKTTLVEYYASLTNPKPIFSLDLSKVLVGTKYRGELEQKLVYIFEEAIKQQFIIFIDEMHALSTMGHAEGSIDVVDMLKPYLLNEEFQIIGATTLDELALFETDRAFSRRFNKIYIHQFSPEQLNQIFIKYLDDSEHLAFSAIEQQKIMQFLDANITKEFYPDKLIDFIEYFEAFMRVKQDVFIFKNKQREVQDLHTILQRYLDSKLESERG